MFVIYDYDVHSFLVTKIYERSNNRYKNKNKNIIFEEE